MSSTCASLERLFTLGRRNEYLFEDFHVRLLLSEDGHGDGCGDQGNDATSDSFGSHWIPHQRLAKAYRFREDMRSNSGKQ
jgi:hypothetical protein